MTRLLAFAAAAVTACAAPRAQPAPSIANRPARIGRVCAYVDANRKDGFRHHHDTRPGRELRLTTEASGDGKLADLGVTFRADSGLVTLQGQASRGVYAISPVAITEVEFRRRTKRSRLHEHVSLAYGIDSITRAQTVLPRETIAIGDRWSHASANEYGGVVTVYRLTTANTIEFERFVCLRDVPREGPDGNLDNCEKHIVEQRLERGILTLGTGLPLPDAEAHAQIRIETTSTCAEPPEMFDRERSTHLRWVATGQLTR